MEWDEHDEHCTHFLILRNNNAIGTARLLKNGQIGRMAILKYYRNQGIGSNLLQYIIDHAKNDGMKSTFVHAQETAIHFYLKKGFISHGDVFMEANIVHQKMKKYFDNWSNKILIERFRRTNIIPLHIIDTNLFQYI